MTPNVGALQSCRVGVVLTLLSVTPTAAYHVRLQERNADWAAPANAASRPNPLASRPDAEAGGRKVFLQRCATCHGGDGRGTSKGPDLTHADVQSQSDGALFWKIGGGNTRAGMPTFSFLPEAQRWQLVLRLRTLASAALER